MKNYITPNFTFAPMVPSIGKGSQIWDTEGRDYIDLSGGIAVNALGHCHPALIEALNQQAQTLWHVSNIYTTEPTQKLAETLVHNTFADKVFFANSGTEANEAALKLARKHAHDTLGPKKNQIISCINAFHGRSLFAVSVGGQTKYQDGFAPLPAGITHIPFNDIDALKNAINENTCAFIVEPIQGESGVLPADHHFLQEARRLCTKYQAALIFDEVQTGVGRTGELFAYQHYGVIPDILSAAKALGSGVPIGAMLTTDTFAPSFTPGSHGTTFGGNPLSAAVALAAFNIINTEDVLYHVKKQGAHLKRCLEDIGQRTEVFDCVRGIGLLLGCVLNKQYQGMAAHLVSQCLNEGLMLTIAGPDVIRFAPSLLLTDQDLKSGLSRFEVAISKAL